MESPTAIRREQPINFLEILKIWAKVSAMKKSVLINQKETEPSPNIFNVLI